MKRALIVMLILITAMSVYAQTRNASLTELSGTVEIKRRGDTDWTIAVAGMTIDADTIVSTGFRSTAVIATGESTIVVRPLTRLTLRELSRQNETETANISLNTGRIRVEVTPSAGSRANLTVQSPSATASVRGTAFEMDTASVTVTEGSVRYGAMDRFVTVRAGQETYIDADTGRVLAPMEVADETRALPPMFGQPPASSGSLTRTETGQGSLGLEIGLNDGR